MRCFIASIPSSCVSSALCASTDVLSTSTTTSRATLGRIKGLGLGGKGSSASKGGVSCAGSSVSSGCKVIVVGAGAFRTLSNWLLNADITANCAACSIPMRSVSRRNMPMSMGRTTKKINPMHMSVRRPTLIISSIFTLLVAVVNV